MNQRQLASRSARTIPHALVLLTCTLFFWGCAGPKQELLAPGATLAPYPAARGELLWAVVPLRNESGTSTVDALRVSDQVVAAVEQVRGLRALPMNRTIETMRVLKMPFIRTPGDAARLADALGVDALVLGSITAYDPYEPRMGLTLALLPRTPAMFGRTAPAIDPIDPRALQTSPTETAPAEATGEPATVVSELFDGKNQSVQMDIRNYAQGRSEAVSAAGWRRYLRSADLFAEFCTHQLINQMMQAETLRLARTAPGRPAPSETRSDSEPARE